MDGVNGVLGQNVQLCVVLEFNTVYDIAITLNLLEHHSTVLETIYNLKIVLGNHVQPNQVILTYINNVNNLIYLTIYHIIIQMALGVSGQIGQDVVFGRVMELLFANVYAGT